MYETCIIGINIAIGCDIMRLLSLFSGCGGMDIGFEGDFKCLCKSVNFNMHHDWVKCELGDQVQLMPTVFQTVFANDIRPDAKAAWVNYFGQKKDNVDDIYHLDSIVDLVKKANGGENVFPESISVVTGGFPCQDFSIAGKRRGFHSHKDHKGKLLNPDEPSIESRGQLYMWMREVITLTEPYVFIAENVKGLVNLDNVKDIIERDFARAGNGGYLVVPAKVLYAPDYGVPQSRERVIFFGFKRNALTSEASIALSSDIIPQEYDPYPPHTHGRGLADTVTCADVLSDLDEPDISHDISQRKYSKAKFMGKHCQGQTEIRWNDVAPTIRSEHHGNIEFRRLSEEHGGKQIEELAKGFMERRLTIRECARIQTFPDDYQFILPKTKKNVGVSASSAYKIIGNAVPPVLAYNIAKNLEAKWHLYFGGKAL